jgi:glutamate synthase domain-containing protein 1
VAQQEFGLELPAFGGYAVGNVFVAKNDTAVAEAKDVIKRILKQRGFKVLGIRSVPTNNAELGASALATEPNTIQVGLSMMCGLLG